MRDSEIQFSFSDLKNGSNHVLKCFNDMVDHQYSFATNSLEKYSVEYFTNIELMDRENIPSEKSKIKLEVDRCNLECKKAISQQNALRNLRTMISTWGWTTIANIIKEKKDNPNV